MDIRIRKNTPFNNNYYSEINDLELTLDEKFINGYIVYTGNLNKLTMKDLDILFTCLDVNSFEYDNVNNEILIDIE